MLFHSMFGKMNIIAIIRVGITGTLIADHIPLETNIILFKFIICIYDSKYHIFNINYWRLASVILRPVIALFLK